MKTHLLIIFLIGFTCFGQNLRIGFNYTLDNQINSDRIETSEYIGYSILNDNSNYSFGLSIEKTLNDNLSMLLGLQFFNRDFNAVYYCEVCDFITPPTPEKFKHQFLEIPIKSRYYIIKNKIQLFGEAGITNSFILKKSELDENSYSISGNLGAGVGIRIVDKLNFEILADYQTALTKFYKISNYKQNLFEFRIGLSKGF